MRGARGRDLCKNLFPLATFFPSYFLSFPACQFERPTSTTLTRPHSICTRFPSQTNPNIIYNLTQTPPNPIPITYPISHSHLALSYPSYAIPILSHPHINTTEPHPHPTSTYPPYPTLILSPHIPQIFLAWELTRGVFTSYDLCINILIMV